VKHTSAITFIGGPMDLKRLEIPGDAPPYYRFAKAPSIGPLHVRPEKPNLILESVSFDYQILPLHSPTGERLFIGLPMKVL
jgi:hypothetical protein